MILKITSEIEESPKIKFILSDIFEIFQELGFSKKESKVLFKFFQDSLNDYIIIKINRTFRIKEIKNLIEINFKIYWFEDLNEQIEELKQKLIEIIKLFLKNLKRFKKIDKEFEINIW